VCKEVDLGALAPFPTVVAVLRDDEHAALPTMNVTRLISQMVLSGELKLLPSYGCLVTLTFEKEGFSRKSSVTWPKSDGVCAIHIWTRDGENVDAPLPLGEGIHRVTVARGAMQYIGRKP
jgi:hypothetical protein